MSWEGTARLTALTERDLPKSETKATSFDQNPWGRGSPGARYIPQPPISFASCVFGAHALFHFSRGVLAGSVSTASTTLSPDAPEPIPLFAPSCSKVRESDGGWKALIFPVGLNRHTSWVKAAPHHQRPSPAPLQPPKAKAKAQNHQ